MAPRVTAPVRRELQKAGRRLGRAPQVLLHRDLQSSNLFLHRGKIALIDFQGMRFGPASYDLASLLCDPYVELSAPLRADLLAGYVEQAPGGRAVRDLFAMAAVQRLAQALGAFAKLGHSPGTSRFLAFIPPALRTFCSVLDEAGDFPITLRLMRHFILQ